MMCLIVYSKVSALRQAFRQDPVYLATSQAALLGITSHGKTHLLTSVLPTLYLCTFHQDTL